MLNVNYLTEIRRFNTYAARVQLSAAAQLLWYKLMEIMNENAYRNGWRDGFLRIHTDYLLTYFPMSATALADARRTLCEYGLLEYLPGERKRTAPAYRLHYFSVPDSAAIIEDTFQQHVYADCNTDCITDCATDCITDCNTNCPNSVDTADCNTDCATDCATDCNANCPNSVDTADCTTDCATDCQSDCATDSTSKTPESRDIYINNTETETETQTETMGTNDDAYHISDSWGTGAGGRADAPMGAHAGTGAREEAKLREIANHAAHVLLHQEFTEAQLDRVMATLTRYPFGRGILIQAIVQTARALPTNPASYLVRVLSDWGHAGVRTTDDVMDYQYARNAATGNLPGTSQEEGEALLASFRAAHRAG